MGDEEIFDLSTLTYDDFLLYFLSHPLSDELWQRDENGREVRWWAKPSRPDLIVDYLTKFFTDFREISAGASVESIDHLVNGILNPACTEIISTLWDESVPQALRLECIRAMYIPFGDFLVSCDAEIIGGAFYMWWDNVSDGFWSSRRYLTEATQKHYQSLTPEDRELADGMFDTLNKILALPDDRCQSSALHGLGHLNHPRGRAVVQKFIDEHRDAIRPDDLKWLQQCRDGTVM
jgi:hypothetical protein